MLIHLGLSWANARLEVLIRIDQNQLVQMDQFGECEQVFKELTQISFLTNDFHQLRSRPLSDICLFYLNILPSTQPLTKIHNTYELTSDIKDLISQ